MANDVKGKNEKKNRNSYKNNKSYEKCVEKYQKKKLEKGEIIKKRIIEK